MMSLELGDLEDLITQFRIFSGRFYSVKQSHTRESSWFVSYAYVAVCAFWESFFIEISDDCLSLTAELSISENLILRDLVKAFLNSQHYDRYNVKTWKKLLPLIDEQVIYYTTEDNEEISLKTGFFKLQDIQKEQRNQLVHGLNRYADKTYTKEGKDLKSKDLRTLEKDLEIVYRLAEYISELYISSKTQKGLSCEKHL